MSEDFCGQVSGNPVVHYIGIDPGNHLPLMIAAQALVCDWQMPALMKFLLIVVLITGLLMISYQLLVRHTWLGLLLNGPRKQLVVSGPAPDAGQ